MSISFPARAACDRCGTQVTFAVTIVRLVPVGMYLALPVGWTVTTKPDSGELRTTCPECVGHESLEHQWRFTQKVQEKLKQAEAVVATLPAFEVQQEGEK